MPRGTSATELGSVSFATSASGSATSQQDFDAWGAVRSGGISATSLNYTGQRLDSTGLQRIPADAATRPQDRWHFSN